MSSGRCEARLAPDPRRDRLWQLLWRYYFRHLVPPDACVLDLGSGYGSFINHVVAARRIAVDSWPEFPRFVDAGVEAMVASATELDFLPDRTVDFAFASNLFEHLTQADFAKLLHALRVKLSGRGTLTILQPNYRYAYREYFDDYTHITAWSHLSMCDFLAAHGYEVISAAPRFLPLTVKSRLPVWPVLVAGYLASPVKPWGKQMLIRARPRK